MEQAAHLVAVLAAQPAPELGPISGLAQLLNTYGAWGVVAILLVAVFFLFKRLEAARDSKDGTLEQQVKAQTALAEEQLKAAVEQTKAAVELKNALVNHTNTLQAFERRLENVEKKLG